MLDPVPFRFLTEDALKSIMTAQAEAGSANSPDAHHFLLGVCQSKGNRIKTLLRELDLDIIKLRASMSKDAVASEQSPEHSKWSMRRCYDGLRDSSYSIQLLALSASEALSHNQTYIGSEHLLLALTQDKQGSQLLQTLGVDRQQWRETITLLIETQKRNNSRRTSN